MKYAVDAALCCGHGQCFAVAPEVFSLDEDGLNQDIGRMIDVQPDLEHAVRDGARACPEQAIRVFS
jgi:ferredoxin